ncbi:RNA polymerase II-associated protein [Epithele typhae]|uniref:RNA polymerase II-associated protein n=1 Tax=Epithele typhae TaxID=378194 RepID=UPI0020078401|nr:RNA polymerase II-associated protein [Epithele typhae]KAH9929574.1 RNA polymerase II-associated protein [Epithele typhae]
MEDADSPPPPGRTIDIELGGQEIITIELDSLDPNPDDLVEVLREGQCKVWIWTRLAAEYWRRGLLEAAEKIARTALDVLQPNETTGSIAPVYSFLANLQIARASKAPKLILTYAAQDNMTTEKPRDEYNKEAAQLFNTGERATAESGESQMMLSVLTRGILQLSSGQWDDAARTFDSVLAEKPTNVVALLGKAKIAYARRQYPQSLKLFQRVLQLNPDCLPDPRIGIGLCFWSMGHKAKAKAAWQRSVEVNPGEWSAQLLLGLEAINASKDDNQSEEERREEFLVGTRLIERAFNANQRNSAAANALCELFLQKGDTRRALKLAERTIQFADVKGILCDGYIRAGRVCHRQGSLQEAGTHFNKAKDARPDSVLATIGVAQLQLKNDEMAGAIHTLDTFLQSPSNPDSVQLTAMLASIRAHSRPGMTEAEKTDEKTRARDLFDRVCKAIGITATGQMNGHSSAPSSSSRKLAEDSDMFIEIAKLYREDSHDRMERAYKQALTSCEAAGKTEPRLVNNLGALQHLAGHLDEARTMYETAVTQAAGLDQSVAEAMSTSILYNLARVYEDQGEDAKARDAYEKLLARHPEYVDGKVRQAHMLAGISQYNDAHELLKQALASQPDNLNLRAYYTYFLMQSNMTKFAKDFVFFTLRDFDKYDVYSLCAAGWIQYYQARELRESSPEAIKERRRGFQRSAEFYEKALQIDPLCAVAAQGLAIVVAEDALGTLGGALGPIAPDEAQKRAKNTREALDIFAKVRESINDGSVHANMGHCYFARGEYDRAIESYETASKRFFKGQDVSVLLCLCRTWNAKGAKDQSFSAMSTALQYAQKALHLQPHDKAILYNIAMIQQKAAEIMIAIPSAKRSLKDLQRAIEQAGHAQKLFASLAADPAPVVPYNRELADQRRKYGESMLRRCEGELTTQRQYEEEAQKKIEAARQRRQEERERVDAAEREERERLRVQNEKLAEERRIAREEAQKWTREVRQMESEEEREKVKKKRPKREPNLSGDEGANGGGEPKPKKRRGGKLKRNTESGAEDEDEALFSDSEQKPKKPRARGQKRAVRDDDDDEAVAVSAPRKKQYKSKETISDSDEEMD